jgi:enamine deaminase RidA (YjgF/YER057c/UK114 family)
VSDFDIVNPAAWSKPVGYSNGIVAEGKFLFLGGQVAFDAEAKVVGEGDLVRQFEQTLSNLDTVCREAGTSLDRMLKLTIFVQDRDEYKARGKELGAIYRQFFGRHYPAMTLVEVARFYETEVLIEIEGIALLP